MKNYLPIAVLLLLTGCPQSENNPNTTMTCAAGGNAFIGCWKTTACTQVKDGAGAPIESWILSQYEFTPDNKLNIANYVYADSSCSGTAQKIPNSSTLPVITYTWTQAITTTDGLAGDKIAVTDTNPATATTINADVDLVITAAGQLCTSNNLILGSGYITVSPIPSTGMDYAHCLDPVIP